MNWRPLLLSFVITLLFCSCQGGGTAGGGQGDSIVYAYATLVPRENVTGKPLQRVCVFTTVHCSLLHDLGVEDRIVGVCDLQYISLPYVQEGVRQGTVADLGNSLEPDIERILDLRPDAIMLSPYEGQQKQDRLAELGIPVIKCLDYMEVSPLARAEWMRYYGRLFGVEQTADSLFKSVEASYNSLKHKAQGVKERPTILSDKPWQGTWYVPGGGSTMGVMYHDAGGDYVFADTKESGSLPLSLETVVEKGADAEYWFIKYHSDTSLTLGTLGGECPLFSKFRAFREGNVYACNTTRETFFEDASFHPDRILGDLIAILHPELAPASAGPSHFHKVKAED